MAMENHKKALRIFKECFGEDVKHPLVSQTLIQIRTVLKLKFPEPLPNPVPFPMFPLFPVFDENDEYVKDGKSPNIDSSDSRVRLNQRYLRSNTTEEALVGQSDGRSSNGTREPSGESEGRIPSGAY